jgi:hypothetical protein
MNLGKECFMTNEALLLLILIILILGVLPAWPYSNSWGYGPTGGLTLVLVILLVWVLAEGRPLFRSTGEDLKAAVQDTGQDLQAAGQSAADSIRRTVQ